MAGVGHRTHPAARTGPIASAAWDLTRHLQHPRPIGAVGGFQTMNYLSQVTYHRDTFISRSWTQPSPAGWKFNSGHLHSLFYFFFLFGPCNFGVAEPDIKLADNLVL